jgi:hypothetical protein
MNPFRLYTYPDRSISLGKVVRTIVSLGVITMQINWLWLAVGLVPYSIKRQQQQNVQLVYTRALFWHLMIRWQRGQRSWELSLPLIEHWRQ